MTEKSSLKKYFISSILPISLYCITYGFRKGWGTDYVVYDELYTNSSRGMISLDNYEPLFRWIVLWLQSIFSSSAALLVLVAALTIFSYIFILKDYRKVVGLGLTMFYLFTAYQASNLIRFFFAVSLVFIGISLFLDKKWIPGLILFIASFCIHTGSILLIVSTLPLMKFDLFLNRKTNLILYFIAMLLSAQFLQNLLGDLIYRILTSVNLGELQLIKYADKDVINSYVLGTRWNDTVEVSIFMTVFKFLYDILFIVLGYNIMKAFEGDKSLKYFYQIGVWGVIFTRMTEETEILYRVGISLVYLSAFVTAYILKYRSKAKLSNGLYYLFILAVAYKGFAAIKSIYSYFDVLYIWD